MQTRLRMRSLRSLGPLVLLLAITVACGGQRFGSVVTEIRPAPDDAGLLHVRSCELVYKKAKPQKVFFGECKRFGLRR